jgi:hypothetical protein
MDNSYNISDFSLQKQFEFHKLIKLIDGLNYKESQEMAKKFLFLYMATQTAITNLSINIPEM